ncbi:MAG: HD domain-containing protein [Anaerolineaceae bacterium]
MPPLTPLFEKAFHMAFDLHSRQARKSSDVPYVAHLLSVCGLVLEMGGSEDEAIAALLHDAVEDQGGIAVLNLIRAEFGDAVAEIVHGCSDCEEYPKPPWRERKESYLAHLEVAPLNVLRVSLADKLHNARDICMVYQQMNEQAFDRFKGGADGTRWYYQRCVEIFSRRMPGVWTNELARVVACFTK